MENTGSVTRWMRGLQTGDEDAVAQLWARYFGRLAGVARARLGTLRAAADEADDVALSAFHSFCRRAEEGHFVKLEGREDLWRLLVVITKRKAISWIRHEAALKRGGGQVRGEAFLAEVIDPEPTPEFAAELLDELQHLLEVLRHEDPALALIALRRLEGYNNAEIAGELSLATRTVERKLQRICICWAADADQRTPADGK
ncbi:MAG: ECF-type sigma factor [Planctomycetota bacterium]|nr:ECF-type sigma factor [Planctomycetota bacterium]